MKRGQKIVLLLVTALAAGGWVLVNPSDGFGVSQFGLTTYRRLPLPYTDLQVRADGSFRLILKSHAVDGDRLAWLLGPGKPEVLIVGLGWRSSAHLDVDLSGLGVQVTALPTPAALARYNELKRRGVRVAIHVHSTC
jgi:hypothetical protein